MKSWRTTLCGVLAAISAVIALVAVPLLDADSATEPNWTAALAAVTAALGLLFARDHKVSSEDAGIK